MQEKHENKAKHHFDGETYDSRQDCDRLSSQFERVKALMIDGKWRTLSEITAIASGTEAAISARLPDLRKERFGSFKVERRRITGENGHWEYRVLQPDSEPQMSIMFDESCARRYA